MATAVVATEGRTRSRPGPIASWTQNVGLGGNELLTSAATHGRATCPRVGELGSPGQSFEGTTALLSSTGQCLGRSHPEHYACGTASTVWLLRRLQTATQALPGLLGYRPLHRGHPRPAWRTKVEPRRPDELGPFSSRSSKTRPALDSVIVLRRAIVSQDGLPIRREPLRDGAHDINFPGAMAREHVVLEGRAVRNLWP